jgi:hypothetical protein
MMMFKTMALVVCRPRPGSCLVVPPSFPPLYAPPSQILGYLRHDVKNVCREKRGKTGEEKPEGLINSTQIEAIQKVHR